jgi:hypothetical protein
MVRENLEAAVCVSVLAFGHSIMLEICGETVGFRVSSLAWQESPTNPTGSRLAHGQLG